MFRKVALIGLALLAPGRAEAALTDSEKLQISTFITKGSVENAPRVRALVARPDLTPEDIRVFPDGDQSVRVEFVFPKTSAIALDDKEVEFVTKMGAADIARKFKLADMTVRGRLAL